MTGKLTARVANSWRETAARVRERLDTSGTVPDSVYTNPQQQQQNAHQQADDVCGAPVRTSRPQEHCRRDATIPTDGDERGRAVTPLSRGMISPKATVIGDTQLSPARPIPHHEAKGYVMRAHWVVT